MKTFKVLLWLIALALILAWLGSPAFQVFAVAMIGGAWKMVAFLAVIILIGVPNWGKSTSYVSREYVDPDAWMEEDPGID